MHSKITADRLAEAFNVSRRSYFHAVELWRTGRLDLCAAVERGEIGLAAALRMAKPEKYGTGKRDCVKEMQRAWRAATPEERETLILWLAEELDRIKTARDSP